MGSDSEIAPTDETAEKQAKNTRRTTWSGIVHLQSSATPLHRVLWFCILVGGLTMALYWSSELFWRFSSHTTETSVTLIYNSTLIFPVVTVCNMNPIRRSAARAFSKRQQELLRGKQKIREDDDWDTRTSEENFYSARRKSRVLARLEHYSPDDMASNSHQIGDMLLSCTFAGYSCSPENFTSVLNSVYSHCFRFNTGISREPRSVTGVGFKNGIPAPIMKAVGLYPYNPDTDKKLTRIIRCGLPNKTDKGLSLELFVQQDEYLESTETAGVKVTLSPQFQKPFPEDDGFTAQPGTRTSIALKLVTAFRTPAPYSTCVTASENLAGKNMFYLPESPMYTQQACYKTMYQVELIKTCGCCDSSYPCNLSALSMPYAGEFERCDVTNRTVSKCMDSLNLTEIQTRECHPTCSEINYRATISTGTWPSNAFLETLSAKAASCNSYFRKKLDSLNTSTDKEHYIRDNLLKVDIFYETLKFRNVSTLPSYQLQDLISDLGGQLGFWLGLSVVAIIEAVEIILKLFFLAAMKCISPLTSRFIRKVKSKTKVIKVTPAKFPAKGET